MSGAAVLRTLVLASAAVILASCSSFSPSPIVTATKEFFSPDTYGAASPTRRMTRQKPLLPPNPPILPQNPDYEALSLPYRAQFRYRRSVGW